MGQINIVNKQTIADEFNNFFDNFGPNLAKNIPAVNNAASIYDYMGQQNLNSMFINPVNETEVIRIIKLCKPEDSMDYDNISMWVFFRGLLLMWLNRLFTFSIFHSPLAYSRLKWK